jgi:2-methylisocitrate lyase-like PEP mutase family enzyme
MPSLAELAELGVARISFGSGLYRTTQVQLASMLTRISAGDDPYQHRG